RPAAVLRRELVARAAEIPRQRRRDVLRCGAMRLSELRALGLDPSATTASTVTNGSYVPVRIPRDARVWRIVGLWLAEGHRAVDGRRMRLCWPLNPETDAWLADEDADYWRGLGGTVDVRRGATSPGVSVWAR